MLIGRERERRAIERVLVRARGGEASSLVLQGEPGVGKTALLRYAIDLAESMSVVRATGVESEAELEFSGLLELCRPLLGGLDALPDVQAGALRGALGLAPAVSGDRYGVGAATLSLLAAAAEERPVLVVVDDLQWLDRASAEALLFAARRLLADPVAFVLAARAGEGRGADLSGLEVLTVEGLGLEAAAELLQQAAGPLPPEAVERLHAATGGNPLALVELPGVLEPEELAAIGAGATPVPAGDRVRSAFARRVEALPEGSRRALVVLAAATVDEPVLVSRALQAAGLELGALEPAEDQGLVELGTAIRFHHPLVRSAVYGSAAPSERRAAHLALAEALEGSGAIERRAWHLAAAAIEPDEAVAAALEDAAATARERRGLVAAAAALEQSALLSPDPARALERSLSAAEAAWFGGATGRATALLEALLDRAAGADRARILHLLGRIERQSDRQEVAVGRLIEAAGILEEDDPATAARVLVDASIAVFGAGDVMRALDVAEQARALAPADGSSADAMTDYMVGRRLFFAGDPARGAEALERALSGLLGEEDAPRASISAATIAHSMLERPAVSCELAQRSTALGRREGPLSLAAALALEAHTKLWFGRYSRAEASGAEGLTLARDLGLSGLVGHFQVGLARIEGMRGAEPSARARLEDALEHARGSGLRVLELECRSVLGQLELALGRHETAVGILSAVAEEVERMGLFDRDVAPWPDLVEALVRLDRVEEAGSWVTAWDDRGPRTSPRWGAALAARCRGLLAEDDAYDALFAEALEGHEEVDDALAAARTLLCHGERLRRDGRRREARLRLRAALERFEALHAEPWSERARRELRASGERLRREAGAGDELTPQELQVALQVAEGKANKEVAAALFLSPKTVEFHLGRIYRKLGVSSRAELVRRYAVEASGVPA